MRARDYIARLFLYLVLSIVVVVAFNYLIDPYAITGAPRVSALNDFKADINEHTRQMKKYHPLQQSYDTLILGTSRAEMGLDPAHPCFEKLGAQVYNLGIPGASLRTSLNYGLNAVYQQPVKRIYFGIDFTDFTTSRQRYVASLPPLMEQTSGEHKYFASGELNPAYLKVTFIDYLKALFSIDATISSIKTLVRQQPGAPTRTERGFNPGWDFKRVVSVEGARALFDQKIQELQTQYNRPLYLHDERGELVQQFIDLTDFLDIAAQRNIEVVLFNNPLHEQFWQIMDDLGHGTLNEEWLSTLQAILRQRGDARVQLWDFSHDSYFIHEPLPPTGERSGPLQWFWEPSHYRRELGDLMLNALLAKACGTEAEFGRRLY